MNSYKFFMEQFPILNRQLLRLQKVSEKGAIAKDLFRVLCLPELFQVAYTNLYANKGAITAGANPDNTLDGMNNQRIYRLISSLRDGTYRPNPVKRIPIPKKDGGTRPLGVPSGDDKLVQEAMRIILEHIYEPVFSENSHGFRPEKSCHTALSQIQRTFTATKFFVEFDIEGFFDNVNHNTLIDLLRRKIDDKRFIKLLRRFLRAGYFEQWKWKPSYSGMPQGGVISPLLSNIYLHSLDEYIESLIESFDVGNRRPVNPPYGRLTQQMNRLRKLMDKEGVTPDRLARFKALEKERLQIPASVENTDRFKRLKYCRYADDFILSVIGSYTDAKNLMNQVGAFLKDNLQLTLSPEKTCVQRATKGIEFLSYIIKAQYGDKIQKVKRHGRVSRQRALTGGILLKVPPQKVRDFCKTHEYGDWQKRKPLHRGKLIFASEAEIIETYNAEMRGFANYYALARDMKRDLHLLFHIGKNSLFCTLAGKRKSSIKQVMRDLKRPNGFAITVKTKEGEKDLEVFQLKHWKTPKICIDTLPLTAHLYTAGSELYRRMNAYECEYCGTDEQRLEVHHVKKLKNLKSLPKLLHWQEVMIARHRKTMVLCVECHQLLHQGKLHDNRFKGTRSRKK